MEKKRKIICLVTIIAALLMVTAVTVFFVKELNRNISDNVISSVSEMAEHDRATIQNHIEVCWKDLYEMEERLRHYDCKTIGEIEEYLNLECATSGFTRICLVGEDGTVYTDKYLTDSMEDETGALDFRPYFADGEKEVFARLDDDTETGWLNRESIFYGIRLKDFSVGGTEMSALAGVSDISSIKHHMVIDSFIKNGKSRGHSALIDRNGNYIVDINKEIYRNKRNNLYEHLTQAQYSEFTNEEVAQKLSDKETFGFYHSHKEEENRELFYFMPFENEMGLYFIMSVNEEVFLEQSRTFTTLSMTMLVFSMLTVIGMLMIVMVHQIKTIAAREKARSQKEFLSNMSHEIRTPLNGLIGMNHLMMVHIDEEERKPQIKEWLKKSNSTAGYLLSLVNDILDMSRIQAGKMDILSEPFLVETMIDEIADMQADNIKSRGVEFTVEKNITVPCVEGDVTRVKQVLMNILGNAAKFTPTGKYIRLTVNQEKADDAHVITVYRCEDGGIGMSREYLEKIFDSFSQEKNRFTGSTKGTGLGMAISKLLTDAMKGDIRVESEPGVGSTFTVSIPSVIVQKIPEELSRNPQENSMAGKAGDSSVTSDRKVRVLVAEDVELNAEVLMEILALEGFEAVHARNGKEALELFQSSEEGEFNVILMDMKMPVMDGCEASRLIRKLDRKDAKSVLIYACTANTFQEDRELALKSGMDDFLAKPIDVSVLLQKTGKAAEQGRL